MSTFPTNLNFSDTTPPPKPDTYNAEFQADVAVPDPNSPGNYVRNGSMCYRVPHVGGAFVLTDNYDLGGPDAGWTFVCNSASPFTITHPAAIPVLPNPEGLWNFKLINLGAGTVTLDLNGLNLDGSGTNPTYATGEGAEISTDGTDLYTCLSSGTGGGGSSTLAADTDVSITSPANRNLLIYHSSDSKWHNDTLVAADIPNIAESQVTGLVSDLASKAVSPLTTKGDIWGRSTVDARIPVGSDGQWLEADSTQTLGVKWANQPYDVVYALPGKPPANTRYLIVTFARPVTFPANFSGAYGHCLTNPTSTATYTLEKNLSNCGTVVISTGGVFTFTSASGAAVNFAAGDYLTLVTPNPQDSTLSDAGFTLAGTR